MKKSLLLAAITALAGFSPTTLSAKTVYEKVTPTESLEEITDGNYIITCPEYGVVMGNPTALSATTFPQVTLADFDTDTETIQPNNGYAVINITKVGTGYHIKTTYGDTEYYLTQAKINQLALTADEKTATIKYEDSKLKIFVNPTFSTTATCYIQYNNQSTGLCFRGYKSVQQPITLFKEVEETVEPEPEPEPEPIERPEILPDTDKGEVLVHVENIDIIDGSFSNGGKVWTSNITPAFSLTFDDNCQLAISGNDDPVLVCNNGTVTITSADPDYYVSGYLFRALSADGNEITIEYPFEGDLLGPDDYGYCYVEGLEEGTEVYFTAQGSQIAFSDIDVIFAPATVTPQPTRPSLTKGENDQLVHIESLNDGTLSNDGKTWTSNTTPQVTLSVAEIGDYKFEATNSGDIALVCGNVTTQHATVTFGSANTNYFVSGYLFKAVGFSGDHVVINYGSKDFTTDETDKYALLEGIAEGSAASFTATPGENGYKKSIISDIDVLLSPATQQPEPEPGTVRLTLANEEGDVLIKGIDLTNGTISNENKTWTSNTTPEFTLTLEGNGGFSTDTNGLLLNCGNVLGQHVTVTIASSNPNYFVSGYVFDATGYAGDQAQITFGNKSFITDGTTKYAGIDGIEEGTAATFTAGTAVAANAKKPLISNLDVRFSPATVIPNPEPEPEVIPDPSTWTTLSRTGWTVSGCSQHGHYESSSDGYFSEIIDGNINTYWHTSWSGSDDSTAPHYLIFDLGEGEHAADGFGYTPRQSDTGNGYVTEYAIYFTDKIDENVLANTCSGSERITLKNNSHSNMEAFLTKLTPAVEGTFDFVRVPNGANYLIGSQNGDAKRERTAAFDKTAKGRYCIFFIKAAIGQNNGITCANCAEFNLYTFRANDHRPAGIAWLDNLAKLTVLYDADAINAAKDAVNTLAEDATEEEVMAAAKTIYDNDPAIGKHVRFLSVKTADTEDATFYLGGNDETMDYVHGEGAESDLSAVWAVVGTDTPGAYRLFNYGKQQYAGYIKTANQKQPWDETGEMFEFVVPTDVDGGCTIEETNQLVIIAHNNNTDPEGYIHFGKNGTDESQWMITTWTSGSAGSHWRISLADENTAEVTGTYNSETGIYTIACADSENPFSHNATRHATHTIGLEFQQPISLFAAQSDETETPADVALTDNGDGTFGLDLSEQPKGQYAISIPMGYFATPNGFSAAHTDVITHDYTTSITEINAEAGNTEWYNMQGIRVAAPAKGGVYLRATSAGVEKVLVR